MQVNGPLKSAQLEWFPTASLPAAADNKYRIVYDSTTNEPKTSDGSSWSSVSAIPPGVQLPYGGTSAPSGYLLCDGSSLLRASYPALFAVIGTAFGAVDGTHFNIPDWRGRFMRGTDGGTGRDPDSASRTAMNVGGNTGNNVGSIQSGQLSSHTHTQNSHTHTISGSTGLQSADHHHVTALNNGVNGFTTGDSIATSNLGAGVGGFGQTVAIRHDLLTGGQDTSHSHDMSSGSNSSTTATNQNTGGNENRPINGYTNFIIKF